MSDSVSSSKALVKTESQSTFTEFGPAVNNNSMYVFVASAGTNLFKVSLSAACWSARRDRHCSKASSPTYYLVKIPKSLAIAAMTFRTLLSCTLVSRKKCKNHEMAGK